MKKFTKKLLTTLIALAITLGLGATAVFAEGEGNQTAGNATANETTKGTTVETEVSESFSWSIPETLDIGTDDSIDLTVSVSANTIAYGNQLTITYAGANDDKDGNHFFKDIVTGNEENLLPYTIESEDTNLAAGTALIVLAGAAEGTNKLTLKVGTKVYAGEYKDVITFTAEVKAQSAQ